MTNDKDFTLRCARQFEGTGYCLEYSTVENFVIVPVPVLLIVIVIGF